MLKTRQSEDTVADLRRTIKVITGECYPTNHDSIFHKAALENPDQFTVAERGPSESQYVYITLKTRSKNKERSERAYRAILARYEKNQSVEENIIDILTDIMHLAPDYGEFEEMLSTARMHYTAETTKTSEVVKI